MKRLLCFVGLHVWESVQPRTSGLMFKYRSNAVITRYTIRQCKRCRVYRSER